MRLIYVFLILILLFPVEVSAKELDEYDYEEVDEIINEYDISFVDVAS